MGNQTIRLGRIFGLEITCNWSLILIFLLVAWTMAVEVFPSAVPGQTTAAYWVSGLVGAAVFYGCLLAHEVSHALVARHQGIRVAGITLWLFGGVTQLDGEAATARDQALITVVGPVTSLLLAGIGFGLAVGLTALGAPALLTTLVAWLAILNLVLGIFNLVPALPLDGGRLLSSLLWWRTHSRERGIHNAVRVGRVFSALLIAAGVLELLTGAIVSGIWLAFVGWFLYSAGTAEDRRVQVSASLSEVPVAAVMHAPLGQLPDWLTVEQVLTTVTNQMASSIYAVHDQAGLPSGFVSWQDLAQVTPSARSRQRLRDLSRPAASFPMASPQENLATVLFRAGPSLSAGVLVMDGGSVVGTLSSSDIARAAASRRITTPQLES